METMSNEFSILCKHCYELLTSHRNVLSKQGVKQVLPIYFEHNQNCLDVVSDLVKNVLKPVVFSNEEHDEWTSLSPETYEFYLHNCFVVINRKIGEFQKRIKKDDITFDEQNILVMMERLLLLSDLINKITKTALDPKMPDKSLRIVMSAGSTWMESCVALLEFLKDAYQVDSRKAHKFLSNVGHIQKNLQKLANFVRRDTPQLQKYLPKLSKALSQFNYELKCAFSTVFGDDDVKIGIFSSGSSQAKNNSQDEDE